MTQPLAVLPTPAGAFQLALAVALLCAPARAAGAAHLWHDFPAFVWRLDHAGEALPDELAHGFGGTNVEGADAAAWARAAGLELYVGSGAGWSDLHLERSFEWYDTLWQRWYTERDPALLVREPCLTAPATRARLRDSLSASLTAHAHDPVRFALVGDEVGLTPWGDPLDLCTSATCSAAWHAWAGARRAELGLADGEPLPGLVETDAVLRALVDGDAHLVGAWLARRRFHQDVVLDVLRDLADHAHAQAPRLPVGLAGLVGQTAFGGVAFERLLDRYDVLEPYAVGAARELAATLRDRQALLATVFVDPAAPHAADDAAHAAWEHWLRGGDGIVVWSDRELAARPDVARRLRETLAALRRLRAELPDWQPRPAGLALVHDADAVALGWLFDALADGATWPRRFAGYQAEHGTRERAVDAWLRLTEDAGLLPGALPLDALPGAGAPQRFPVLVLCHLRVLSDGDIERLARHLERGGTLFVDGPLGTFDRAGRRRADDVRAALAERAPERVLATPDGLASYLADRAAAPRRAARLRERFAAALAAAGVAAPAARVTRALPGASAPWLVAEQRAAAGRVLACLPQRDGVDAADAAFAIELAGARAVRWLWPPLDEHGQRSLAPGDAAVVVVE